MIPLNTQIKIIAFSFIYGIFLYLVFKIFKKAIYCNQLFFRLINTFSFTTGSSLLYFVGLEIFVDGIFHTYSLLVIFVSFYLCAVIANKLKK